MTFRLRTDKKPFHRRHTRSSSARFANKKYDTDFYVEARRHSGDTYHLRRIPSMNRA